MTETQDFGDFDYKVKVFKRYVTVSNVKIRDLIIKKEFDCDCWVDIKSNYKDFTATDVTKLATSMYSADMFEMLMDLKNAAKATGTDANTLKRAKDAQAALADLAPTGKNWQQYSDMIQTVYDTNKTTYLTKLHDNHVWLLDDMAKDFKAAGLNGTLDKAKLEDLATDIKTVRGFTRLVNNAKFCAESEEYTDSNTGQTKKRYTSAAKHGQEILGALAADGDWKTLYKNIFTVELAQRQTYFDLIDKLHKQEDAQKKSTGSITLPKDVRLGHQEIPVVDQQMATALLNQRGVIMAANDDTFILPPEVKSALQAKRVTGVAA